ncbi:MAG: hypothetical protein N4A49_06690 [Marinifilaceae bacterium]|jgi:hypothetical protein|nr:hypothetical protein [Marinifilaceae bacterium]
MNHSYNFLKRVLVVQEYYLERNKIGIPDKVIIGELEEKNIYISRSTFYEYLHIPAKRLIKEKRG